jgi:superfamily II RNA helicase
MAAKKLSTTGLTEATLTKLAQDLQRQLESNSIYRELTLVRKALAEIQSSSSSTKTDTAKKLIVSSKPSPQRLGRVTAVSAACEALKEAGRPMSIHELLEALPKHGFRGGGNRPAGRLSSYLSKQGKRSPISSIYVDNKPMWWFRDQPVPERKA